MYPPKQPSPVSYYPTELRKVGERVRAIAFVIVNERQRSCAMQSHLHGFMKSHQSVDVGFPIWPRDNDQRAEMSEDEVAVIRFENQLSLSLLSEAGDGHSEASDVALDCVVVVEIEDCVGIGCSCQQTFSLPK